MQNNQIQTRTSEEIAAEITQLEARRVELATETKAAQTKFATTKTAVVMGLKKSADMVPAKTAFDALQSAVTELDEMLEAKRGELASVQAAEKRELDLRELQAFGAQKREISSAIQVDFETLFTHCATVFQTQRERLEQRANLQVQIEYRSRRLGMASDSGRVVDFDLKPPIPPKANADVPDEIRDVVIAAFNEFSKRGAYRSLGGVE